MSAPESARSEFARFRRDVGPRLKLLAVGLLWLAVVGGASIALLTAFGPR